MGDDETENYNEEDAKILTGTNGNDFNDSIDAADSNDTVIRACWQTLNLNHDEKLSTI